MGKLTDRLEKELNIALETSKNIHALNIKQDFLPVFERAAKEDPYCIEPVVALLKNHMEVHRSNCIPALYILMRLGDISPETRGIVQRVLGDDLAYYEGDNDQSISGNARILQRILKGESLANFPTRQDRSNMGMVHIEHNHGDIAIASGDASSISQNTNNSSKMKIKSGEKSESTSMLTYILGIVAGIFKSILGL